MKKLLSLLLLSFAAIQLTTESAKASHAQGADIAYAYTGNPNEYLVTLRFYRDCAGIAASPSAIICYQSASLGFDSSATIYPVFGTGNPIPLSPCVNATGNCSSGFGTEEWIYQGIINLPQAATDWIFAYETCCRNFAISTLVNATSEGLYVSTHLNNVDFPTNSSPYFDSIPVTTFCVNNQFYYYQGAHDVNNDSLHFSLVDAQDALGFCPYTPYSVAYNPPYSGANPLSTANGITIDPLTGIISFVPDLIQVAVICVLVEDYDTTQFPAVKKGSSKRDLQIIITNNCVSVQPSPILVSSGGYSNALNANCRDTSIILPLSDLVQCGSIAADGSDFRAVRPDGQPNAIYHAEPVNCVSGKTDSVRIFFYYPLTKVRTALYIKKGTDGNTMLTECGNSIYETNGSDTITTNDTINIIVQDTAIIDLKIPVVSSCIFTSLTVNLNDQLLCSTIRSDASDFKLTDATGALFILNQAYGNCLGTIPLSPDSFTTSLTVVSSQTISGVSPFYLIAMNGNDSNTISNLCGTFYNVGDTIAVIDAAISPAISLGPDISQCINLPFPVLDAGAFAGSIYLWSTGETTQTIIADTSGTYMVTVTYGTNCSSTDTVSIDLFDAPIAPGLTDQNICYNDTIAALNANPSGNQPASTVYSWTDATGNVVNTTSIYTPGTSGTYTVTISNNVCTITDDAIVAIEPQLPINLGSSQTICGAPIALDAGFASQVSTYNWTKDNAPFGSAQNVNANGAGIYIVTITTSLGCTSTASVLIEAGTFATNITGDQQICETNTATFNVAYTGTATVNYKWTYNGNATGANLNLLTASTPGTYSVLITDQFGCTATSSTFLEVEKVLEAPVAICHPQPPGNPFAYIYTWEALPDALGYEVSLDDGVSWITPNEPQGLTSEGVTSHAATFVVRALGNLCPSGKTSEFAPCMLAIPNVVTPNNDGLNDTFSILNLEQYANAKISIFNQWGKEIYNNDNYSVANNYAFKDQPDGTYFYTLSITGEEKKSGTINLLHK
ncbi:MAG: gliding motility-associated C-terminal domain-containing protein [Bacteroidia bacterium]